MKKNTKTIIRNILSVTMSNITTIFAGVVVGFIIPKIFTVEDYGFYKVFTLYITYIGFFSLGIIDGIVLKFGGYDYDKLNKPKFRSYFIIYLIIHIFFTLINIIISFLFSSEEYKFIFVFIALNITSMNLLGYFQQISQITQRHSEYSIRKIVQSILTIASVLILLFAFNLGVESDYRIYIIITVAINYFLAIWYIVRYREIILGRFDNLIKTVPEIMNLSITGFPLLFANLSSTLILTLDRQFISILFSTSIYAYYAFAYSMLSLVTVATSAISRVLYPTLKRTTLDTLKENYSKLIVVMTSFVFASLASYFPLSIFINWYLPSYNSSLEIFRVIFPGIAISSSIIVVMHNYYKTLGDSFLYFKKNIVVLCFSVISNFVAFKLFKSQIAISWASIITMLLWYLYVESYFVKKFKYNNIKNTSYILIMMASFYIISTISNHYIALLIYISCFLVVNYLFYREVLYGFWNNVIRRRN